MPGGVMQAGNSGQVLALFDLVQKHDKGVFPLSLDTHVDFQIGQYMCGEHAESSTPEHNLGFGMLPAGGHHLVIFDPI